MKIIYFLLFTFLIIIIINIVNSTTITTIYVSNEKDNKGYNSFQCGNSQITPCINLNDAVRKSNSLSTIYKIDEIIIKVLETNKDYIITSKLEIFNDISLTIDGSNQTFQFKNFKDNDNFFINLNNNNNKNYNYKFLNFNFKISSTSSTASTTSLSIFNIENIKNIYFNNLNFQDSNNNNNKVSRNLSYFNIKNSNLIIEDSNLISNNNNNTIIGTNNIIEIISTNFNSQYYLNSSNSVGNVGHSKCYLCHFKILENSNILYDFITPSKLHNKDEKYDSDDDDDSGDEENENIIIISITITFSIIILIIGTIKLFKKYRKFKPITNELTSIPLTSTLSLSSTFSISISSKISKLFSNNNSSSSSSSKDKSNNSEYIKLDLIKSNDSIDVCVKSDNGDDEQEPITIQ